MNTPPPPPFHSFNSPYSNSFGIQTPDTGSSFDTFSIRSGSSRYSDNISLRTGSVQPKIETREPIVLDDNSSFSSRPSFQRSQTTPASMASTFDTDYLHFKFGKEGARWDDRISVEEMVTSESQIKKLVESKNDQGTASQQLRKMGPGRRARINEQIRLLDADERGSATWEPVYINSTKMKTRVKEGVMDVREFEIVFARKQAPKSQRMGGDIPSQPPTFQTEAPKAEAKKEKRKSKDKKAEKPPARDGLMDDPFSATPLFDTNGAVLGSHGPATTSAPGLPPYIAPEKPIGTLNVKPHIVEIDVDAFGNPVIGGTPMFGAASPVRPGTEASRADEVLNDLQFPHHNDIIPVHDSDPRKRSSKRESKDRSRRHKTRSKSRSRSVSRSRPQRTSFRQSSDSPLPRSVHFQDSRFGQAGSSGSSIVSGDTSLGLDEVEELSSHTSEETWGSSPGPKYNRYVTPARQHTPGPVSPPSPQRYELSNKTVTMSESGRRRISSRAKEQSPYGFEQPQPVAKRNTSPRLKPIVTQLAPPSVAPTSVPPFAEYPNYYEDQDHQQREHDTERHVDSYIRDSIRQSDLREREESLNQRERAMKAQQEQQERQREAAELRQRMEKVRLDREFGSSRQTVYTYEPRNRQ